MSVTELFLALLGEDLAQRLFKTFGGMDYYFPKSLGCTQANNLREVLGDEATRTLIQHFAGETLYIPKGEQWYRHQRDEKIKQAVHQAVNHGASYHDAVCQVAIKFNMTKRWIYHIAKRPEPVKDERQLAFDWY